MTEALPHTIISVNVNKLAKVLYPITTANTNFAYLVITKCNTENKSAVVHFLRNNDNKILTGAKDIIEIPGNIQILNGILSSLEGLTLTLTPLEQTTPGPGGAPTTIRISNYDYKIFTDEKGKQYIRTKKGKISISEARKLASRRK